MSDERADQLGRPMLVGLRLALNVRMQGIRPELVLGLMIVSGLCIEHGITAVITTILNGAHMRNSLHYTGAAVDFLIGEGPDRKVFVDELRERLGPDFDVIDEGDHIHVEYQPHLGALT